MCVPCDKTLTFDLLLKKKLNLRHNFFNQKRWGSHITCVHFLWQDLSLGTKYFDLLTLTLTFDLLLKKLNIGINFWTERDSAFKLSMDIPWGESFQSISKFWSTTLTSNFDLILKKNLTLYRKDPMSFQKLGPGRGISPVRTAPI